MAYSTSLLLSYLNIRAVIGALAILLPPLVLILNWNPKIQSSISAYYHVSATHDVFVAVMCAIGLFLFSYNGYSDEWFLHKLMGLGAIGIGLCPTAFFDDKNVLHTNAFATIHNISAVVLFAGMAVMSFFFFARNQDASGLSKKHKAFNAKIYQICGGIIAVVGLLFGLRIIYFLMIGSPVPRDSSLFFVEWISIWSFGVAWFLKSHIIFRILQNRGIKLFEP
jgi:hypothetical protein